MSQDHGFPGVVGHARVTDMLSRAIERQRLHHGLVFSGPRGIGKATLARGLACALICDVAPARGCGSCDACRRLLSGRHTDLRRLEGQGKTNTIAAEPAREVALRSQHAPFEARAHLIIIDPADRMHPRAAAALLKSIEEPSAGVYWTLIGANRSDILDTILSRCMTIPLEGLSLADTRAVVLAELARDSAGDPIDDARRELAISLADGSPGVALELLRDPSLEPTRELLAATLRALELGPPAVFSGERSPLWSAWNTAVLATADPSAAPDDGDDDEDEVVVVKSKRKPKKAKKSKKSKSDSKASPGRQRAMAGRLAELWLLHLRELLLGREGLHGMPRLHTDSATASHMQSIQQFQTNLARNPNVRLNFEQLLLSLGG
ncbi:DNA polymerase III subunit [Enhygromyxa salina]|uniref:DNA polymerase III subunit n=1 Tax=Enhygromyxa salina TaxID=215803 RepID=UPI000D025F8B|nr:DNA polymerase III subunit [Enhygromyxa salina]